MNRHLVPQRAGRQRGAAAIEFSLLFLIFFAVLYAIVGYGLALLIHQGLAQAAAEGARAAVRLDPMRFATQTNYQSAVTTLARDAVINAASWMPLKARNKIATCFSTTWNTGTRSIVTGGTSNLTITTRTLTVTVSYNGYASDPIIPALTLPGIGSVPRLPANLSGKASIQLQQ